METTTPARRTALFMARDSRRRVSHVSTKRETVDSEGPFTVSGCRTRHAARRAREIEEDAGVRLFGIAATLMSFGIPAAAQEMPPSASPPSALVVDLNFLLGQKYLDRDDWGKTLDEQFATGLETTWRRPGWYAGIAIDALFANAEKRSGQFADEQVLRGSTLELAAGVRAVVPFGRIRPYLGAGAEIAQADVQTIRRADADDAKGGGGTGWWAGGGVYARLGKTANLGLCARWSTAEVSANGFKANAGGMTYAVVVGFGIPPYEPDEE